MLRCSLNRPERGNRGAGCRIFSRIEDYSTIRREKIRVDLRSARNLGKRDAGDFGFTCGTAVFGKCGSLYSFVPREDLHE